MKKYYHIWTDIDLRDTYGFKAVYTECDQEGVVAREIGIDLHGKVIYRLPPQMLDRQRGIFEFMRVDLGQVKENLTAEEFEAAWSDV